MKHAFDELDREEAITRFYLAPDADDAERHNVARALDDFHVSSTLLKVSLLDLRGAGDVEALRFAWEEVSHHLETLSRMISELECRERKKPTSRLASER